MVPNELKSLSPLKGKERLGAYRDSEYLGAEDIEPGSEPVLTIAALYNGFITLARGKERHDVIAFEEEKVPGMINQVRPLVVNATNRKTLRKLFKNVTADTLVGKKIQLFLQAGVRDPSTGDKVDGIRIRDKAPEQGGKYVAPKCAVCGKDITGLSGFTPEQIAATNQQRYGKPMCVECGKKHKEELEKAAQKEQEEASKAQTDNDEGSGEEAALAALQAELER